MVNGVLLGFVATRYGLLAIAAWWLYRLGLSLVPLPLDLAPYATSSIVVLGLLLALLVYGFRISLGSRPLFATPSLDD